MILLDIMLTVCFILYFIPNYDDLQTTEVGVIID
jgi:hypothetical protein